MPLVNYLLQCSDLQCKQRSIAQCSIKRVPHQHIHTKQSNLLTPFCHSVANTARLAVAHENTQQRCSVNKG
eukprot:3082-Heterococcus_DN1.PRE.1